MIRVYSAADTDAIIDVWYRASLEATPFLPKRFLDEERDDIRNIWLQKADTVVYVQDGRVVGFLSLIGNEVGAIFVLPEAQGRGIGRTLMDYAVSLRGDLVLDVFEDNARGRRFYERYGFAFESRHRHDATGCMQHRLRYESAKASDRSSDRSVG